MNNINLSNVKISNDTVQLEFLYKNEYINDNSKLYFEDINNNQYFLNVHKCKNKVNYSYNNEFVEVAKVFINFRFKNYGFLKLYLNDSNNKLVLNILDNKNAKISTKDNPYMIFYKDFKIQLLDNGINFVHKKSGDKLKYELKKQLYGLKKYRKFFVFRLLKSSRRKYYLFNDRLLYGDDNAEELFKFVCNNKLDILKNSFFVIDKNSLAFNRISSIGRVLKFGSLQHKLKFLNSRIVLSSHSSYLGNCFNPFSEIEMDLYKDLINKQFVFLQHGIVMNDVRQYLNRELTTADLFITSTNAEYNYVSSEDFMYEPNMVVPTGLPRFDKLKNDISNVILISPTWRAYDESLSFEASDYYANFSSLLKNAHLLNILKTKNYKIKFLLHPVFDKYKYLFDKFKNDYVQILTTGEIKYFSLFNECALFITDYSSIHFDVATLEKPILYYQFDKDFFFNNHYQAGYFDYQKDGFGKVVYNEADLIDELDYYLNNNCKIKDYYKEIIERTFIHLDHNNSKRVMEEVLKLDKTEDINYRFNNVH